MKLKPLPFAVSICKLDSVDGIEPDRDFFFVGKTDEEISLVCKTADVPTHTEKRDDGWKGFFIEGPLDFSLIGVLSRISTLLAGQNISIFAVSTYTTDYIFVKDKDLERALTLLSANGYTVLQSGLGATQATDPCRRPWRPRDAP